LLKFTAVPLKYGTQTLWSCTLCARYCNWVSHSDDRWVVTW